MNQQEKAAVEKLLYQTAQTLKAAARDLRKGVPPSEVASALETAATSLEAL